MAIKGTNNSSMEKNVKVITCGCRFNRFESAEIKSRINGDTDKPLVVVNTCAVTQRSEAKSRRAILRAIRENPASSIVVAGCLAEFNPEPLASIEGVALVLGNEEKFSISDHFKSGEKIKTGGVKIAKEFGENHAEPMEDRTAAYLKIQNGCDDTCSFCVVRIVRGQSRSATPEFIFKRIDEIIAGGAKEIVLTGINIGQYGNDLPNKPTLAFIMGEISKRSEARFRLSSINPNDITDELISLFADRPNICRHMHVPLQSGSDEILKKMRRPYTASEYKDRLQAVAEKLPGLGLGCDVMAGFPGETERDFLLTLQMMAALPFTYAHVFTFSPREKTGANEMDEMVDDKIKQERVEGLKQLAAMKNLAFRKKLIGSEMELLVEINDSPSGDKLNGKSDTFVEAEFDGTAELKGKIVRVRVTGLTEKGVTGEVL